MVEPELRLRAAIVDDSLSTTIRILRRFPYLVENIDYRNGWTNLHLASYCGHYLIASNLIKLIKSYDLDRDEIKRSFKRETYLHCCIPSGNEQTMHLLLKNFKELVDEVDVKGRTAAHLCCLKLQGGDSLLQLLVEMGANLNIADHDGNTPLHLALEMGNLKCIKTLVSSGEVDFDVENLQKYKPQDLANSFDTVKFFDFYRKNVTKGNGSGSGQGNGAVPTPIVVHDHRHDSDYDPLRAVTPVKSHLPPLPSVSARKMSSSNSVSNSPSMNSMVSVNENAETSSSRSRSRSISISISNSSMSLLSRDA